MFSFFKSKEPTVDVKDVIWLNENAKFNALAKAAQQNFQTIFIAWFDETYEKIQNIFAQKQLPVEHIFLANKTWRTEATNNPVIFVEHYPLAEKEEEFYQYLNLKTATVYTSVDEPLLKKFGGDNLMNVMTKMSMKEDEPIEHAMITTAIKRMQEKIKKKISFEASSRSQEEWVERNLN